MTVGLRQGICSSVLQIGAMFLGILTPALRLFRDLSSLVSHLK